MVSSDSATEPMLAHMVYFTLKDDSPETRERLVAACHEHLSGHPGTVCFAAGVRTPDLQREVNDSEFHVALQTVFQTRADHDRYQVSERHQQFIEGNRENWAQVRVFDANVR